MSNSLMLRTLQDRVTLLDLEPGPMSQQKQAYEILQTLQTMATDELSVEDVELHAKLKARVMEIMGV